MKTGADTPIRALPALLAGQASRERVAAGATMAFAGLLEVAVWQMTLYGQLPGYAALAFHGVVCLLLGGMVVLERREGEIKRSTALFAVLTCLAGPFGAVAAGLALVWASTARRAAREEVHRQEMPDAMSLGPAIRVTGPGAARDTDRLLDIMTFGTQAEKQEIVDELSQEYHAGLKPVIDAARQDDDPRIRASATAAVSALRDTYADMIVRLEARDPRDRETERALGEANELYAESGLLERAQTKQRRAVALSHYANVLEIEPSDFGALESIGRMLVGEGRYSEAAACLRDCLECGGLDPKVLSLYLDCLLNLGNTDEIRDIAAQAFMTEPGDAQLEPAFALWREPEAAEAAHA